jgi:phosphoglycolate phosphatase-like HAD superfamily hydrolase
MFDCDGVMFDSRRANELFYNGLLARFGLPPMDPEECAFVHTHTARDSVAHIFRDHPELDALEAMLRVDYSPYIPYMAPEPGLKAVLEAYSGLTRLAVCTNRTTTIGQVLEHHGVARYFDLVVSALDVPRPKPFPDQLEKALGFFGCAPTDAAYVGDSELDSMASDAAGVPFVAYANPGLAPARWHIKRLSDLELYFPTREAREALRLK